MTEHRQSAWSAPPAGVDADIVMFLLGPDGERLDDEPVDTSGWTMTDLVRAFRASIQAEGPGDPFGRRRAGPRPVQGTGRSRAGYRDEIMITLRSAPVDAVAEAVSGEFLEPPIRSLRVDPTSLTSRRFEVSWTATFRSGVGRRRPVRLRLYASPSLNITALAMSPIRPRSAARRSFVRIGNRAMEELGRRLDEQVDHSG